MPKANITSISVPRERAKAWQQAAIDLGYGENGRQKLLDVMLEVAEAHPSLFRKR